MGLGQWLLRAVYSASGLAAVAVALLYFFQDKLLYVPKIPGIPEAAYAVSPERLGLEAEDVILTTKDGVKIHGWLLKLPRWSSQTALTKRPVILFFQENAGPMTFRLSFLRLMMHRLDCPVFAVSYRGYGLSEGRPSQRGLQLDAQAALEHLSQRKDVNGQAVVVYGRSLGGAVATHLVAAHQSRVVGLIVENTFLSVEDMVSKILPPLGMVIGPGKPMNFLVTNKWHNRDAIKKINNVPILMIVSELDEMVPASQMHALYNLNQSSYCHLVSIKRAHHMDAYDVSPDLYWGELKSFMTNQVETKLGSA